MPVERVNNGNPREGVHNAGDKHRGLIKNGSLGDGPACEPQEQMAICSPIQRQLAYKGATYRHRSCIVIANIFSTEKSIF